MDFTYGVTPISAAYNLIYTYVWTYLTKLVKIILCMVVDGSLSLPSTVKLFLDHVMCSYRAL